MKALLIALELLTIRIEAAQKTYTVTAYCACKECCGPDAFGYTASGKRPVEGITIAAPTSIPFGTTLNISGVGRRIVQDRLATRYNNRIDVFMKDHKKAKQFGKRRLIVSR